MEALAAGPLLTSSTRRVMRRWTVKPKQTTRTQNLIVVKLSRKLLPRRRIQQAQTRKRNLVSRVSSPLLLRLDAFLDDLCSIDNGPSSASPANASSPPAIQPRPNTYPSEEYPDDRTQLQASENRASQKNTMHVPRRPDPTPIQRTKNVAAPGPLRQDTRLYAPQPVVATSGLIMTERPETPSAENAERQNKQGEVGTDNYPRRVMTPDSTLVEPKRREGGEITRVNGSTNIDVTLAHSDCHLHLEGSVLIISWEPPDSAPQNFTVDLNQFIGVAAGQVVWGDAADFPIQCDEFKLSGTVVHATARIHNTVLENSFDLNYHIGYTPAGGFAPVLADPEFSAFMSTVSWMNFTVIAQANMEIFLKNPAFQKAVANAARRAVVQGMDELRAHLEEVRSRAEKMMEALEFIETMTERRIQHQVETLVRTSALSSAIFVATSTVPIATSCNNFVLELIKLFIKLCHVLGALF
ncbi:hypothetical protein C8R45DRAFT_1224487 [Mycena sanguinolenta]|nr:hypothetical protein C8R45DRAFT_1224487 [Mycena sanguinolenta]